MRELPAPSEGNSKDIERKLTEAVEHFSMCVSGSGSGLLFSGPIFEAPRIQRKLGEAVKLLVEACHPQRLILFGSYARGT